MSNKNLFSKLRWLLVILCSLSSVTVYAAAITDVRVNHFDNYTRVIFNISSPDEYNAFTLNGPHRVVVDFYKGHLKANIKELNFGDTIITRARSGRPVPETLRIVFDVAQAAAIKSSFIRDNNPGEAQLVVDIFAKNARAQTTPKPTPATEIKTQPAITEAKPVTPALTPPPPPVEPVVKPTLPVVMDATPSVVKPVPVSVPIPAPVEVKPVVQTPPVVKTVTTTTVTKTVIKIHHVKPQLVETLKPHSIVVMLDPGHGGKDTGTIGKNGVAEKNVVLAIAQRLATLINRQPNMRAVLTRNGDYFVTLQNRLMLSRQSKADLFIAIHADSYFNDQSIGASVYALSRHGASSMAARWLADRENHSELGGVDLNELGDKSYILRSVLIDLAQTATITDSIKLGTDVLDGLEYVTTLHYPHVEQAPFMVLKSPDIPSILVETGFLSNPSEEERLSDPIYRDKLARALLEGIHRYTMTHPMLATTTRPVTAT